MSLLVVGLNHRTAPLDVREQFAFSREGVSTALMLFRNQFPDCEAAIISTCNRVEMIVAKENGKPTHDDIVQFFAQARDLPVKLFRHYLYELKGERAVRHLFRVAGGLDSMVFGEYQIVSQCKTAYAQASEQGTTGRVLNRLFHQAFCVSKRLRSETDIGKGKVSVPSVAVDVAGQIFEDFVNKKVLVVGSGEMARLVCEHLREADARLFTVTGRTLSNTRALAAACDGTAVPYDQLDDQLAEADIIITATSCPKAFITAERFKAAQRRRKGRPAFLIDLAVPRNVEPAVDELRQVYVYDIDALGEIVAKNQEQRAKAMAECEAIVDEAIGAYEQWLNESRVQPLIGQMYRDAREVTEGELARLFNANRDLTDEQRDAIEKFAHRLTMKMMHPAVQLTKETGIRCSPQAQRGKAKSKGNGNGKRNGN
jgi:glutamyl-tRNA reductase